LLQEHECLIDFIAVSPEARGRGVGAALMRWAEQTGASILAETEAAAVAAQGVDMTLWVGVLLRCPAAQRTLWQREG
jgi:GNAT superfamily N-acetyltransferase